MKIPLLPFLLLLLLWGLAATAAGAVHLLASLPPSVVPVLVGGLTVSLTVAALHPTWAGDAVSRIGLRRLLAFHLIRFVGFYFLWLHAQGRLHAEFANRAGWGDIVAAAGALGLLFWPDGPAFRRALAVWNVVGLADLVVAVGTGGWLNLTRPGSMAEMSGLPLTLVPLWIVPVLMASHFVIFRRLGRTAAAVAAV